MSRAFRITADGYTYVDGIDAKPTPADALDDFGIMLNRVSEAGDEVVVMLPAATLRFFDIQLGERSVEAAPHIDRARAAGWNIGAIGPWTTFYRGARSVYVGFEPLLTAERFPLVSAEPVQTMLRIQRWHDLTGSAYHGTPGIAAISIMRAQNRTYEPTWQSKLEHRSTFGPNPEIHYHPMQWSAPMTYPEEHRYDINRAYLAAASVADLPVNTLRHTGPRGFTPELGGYWLVEPSPWHSAELMPNPAGYIQTRRDTRWLTTPTMKLLTELTESDYYAMPSILDSWTSPNRRLLRTWAERLERVCTHWQPIEHDPDGPPAIRETGRRAYREAIGLMNRPGGMVYRPDWHHTIVATARTNLWRKLWKYGQHAGQWPIAIEVDAAIYSRPTDLPIAARLGGWKLVKSEAPE